MTTSFWWLSNTRSINKHFSLLFRAIGGLMAFRSSVIIHEVDPAERSHWKCGCRDFWHILIALFRNIQILQSTISLVACFSRPLASSPSHPTRQHKQPLTPYSHCSFLVKYMKQLIGYGAFHACRRLIPKRKAGRDLRFCTS